MIVIRSIGILEKYTMYPLTLCSFWGNIRVKPEYTVQNEIQNERNSFR